MATVYVSYVNFAITGGDGLPAIVARGEGARSEAITSSGTSAQGGMTATGNQVAIVYCGTAVVVNTGANPTAALATGVYVPAALPYSIGIRNGHKLAVIDA